MTANEMGYFGPRATEMMLRDHTPCKCQHMNQSHASRDGDIGGGACGFCDCETFAALNASEDLDKRFTVTKGKHELDRIEALAANETTPNRLWTIVEGERCDCDDDNCCDHEWEWYALTGFHYVNAMNWILTDQEWAAEDEKIEFIYTGYEDN